MSDTPTYDLTTAAGQRAHYAASRARILNAKPKLRGQPMAPEAPAPIPIETEPVAIEAQPDPTPIEGEGAAQLDPHLMWTLLLFLARHNDCQATNGPMITDIIKLVCGRYKVTKAHLISPMRNHSITLPRHIAIYLARELTNRSTREIARRFGGRDHSTAVHAISRIRRQIAMDSAFAGEVEGLKQELAGMK